MAVSFDTVFKIGAVFTGAAVMNQVQSAVTKTGETAVKANENIKKFVTGFAGLAAAGLTVDKVTGFINNSIDAARKAKAAYQGISDSLNKIPQMQKLGTAAISDQTAKLKDLAQQLQRTGVIASESLAAGFAKFVDEGFSPAKIGAMSKGFEDIIVRIKGVKASGEDAADIADKLGNAILKGGQEGGQALVNLGVITQDQVEKFASIQNATQRYNYTLGEMGKHVDDTAAAMKTWDGVQQRFQNAWKDIKVALGTPFMEAQDKVTAKMGEIQQKLIDNAGKISTIVTPLIEKFADKIGDALIGLIDSLDRFSPQIEWFFGLIDKGFSWIINNADKVGAGFGFIADQVGKLATGDSAGAAKNIANLWTAIADGLTKVNWKQIGEVIGQGFIKLFVFERDVYVNIGTNIAAGLSKVDWPAVANQFGQLLALAVKGAFYLAFVLPRDLGDRIGNYLKTLDWRYILDEGLTKVLEGAMDIGWNIIDGIIKGITGKDMHEIGDALWKACTDWAKPIGDWFNKNVIDVVVDLFKGLPKLILDALSSLASTIMKPLQDFGGKVQEWWGGVTRFFGGQGGQNTAGGTGPGGQGLGAGPGVYNPSASAVPAGTAISAQAAAGATPPMRALSFGPVSGDKGHAANYSQYGSGPADSSGLHALMPDDIAVSQEMLGKFPMGSAVDIVKNGKLMWGHQKVADTSWFNNPTRPTHTFEQRHVEDLGTAQLVKSAAFGGIFSHPALTAIAERVPEMALPLEGTSRSRSLLSSAAERIGMGSMLRGGGGGPMHLNMTAPITIHGVQAGQEGAIAREVQKALEDPIRRLLDQLKKAKAHEQRLSYA